MTLESDAPPTPSDHPAPAPPPAKDDEHALRLFPLNDWFAAENRLNSGAFYHPTSPPESLFVKERLPGEDGRVLHVDGFRSFGRIRIQVGRIRSFTRNGVHIAVDLLMTGTADPPLEPFGDAHAELTGIRTGGASYRKKVAQAFSSLVNEHGVVEKVPDGPPPTE